MSDTERPSTDPVPLPDGRTGGTGCSTSRSFPKGVSLP